MLVIATMVFTMLACLPSWNRRLQHTSLHCLNTMHHNIHLEITLDIIVLSNVANVLIWLLFQLAIVTIILLLAFFLLGFTYGVLGTCFYASVLM